MRACVPVVCVPTCLHASVFYVPTCQRASFSFLRANVPINVPMHQCAKGVPIFQTFRLWNAKGNFYTLLLYKKFYIILDVIVIHNICICIVHKNYIILHFELYAMLKKSVLDFLFSLFLFSSLFRNENIKRPGFYALQVTRVFMNFP